MGQVRRFHVEVDFSSEPVLVNFAEECGDEAEEGCLIGKEGGDAGSAFEFEIDAFESVAGAQASLMGGRESEDGEALWDIFFHPSSEFWGGFGIGCDEVFETLLSRLKVRAVEDGADVGSDLGAHVKTRDVGLGVLLEMELAALPRDGRKDGTTGSREPDVGIADDQADAVKAAGLERGEEVAPMDLGLAEGNADTEDRAFAIGADPDGDEDGAIDKLTAVADFFVTGIEDDIGEGTKRTITPDLEFGIELCGAVADLGGTHRVTAEFLDDFRDLAGGDTLDIHLGQGKHEGSFAADAFFQGAGIEVNAIADLRDTELDGAETGGEGFWFEPVGTPEALATSLIRASLERGGTFLDHGLIDEDAEALGKAGGAFGGQELQNGVQEIRIKMVGHVCVLLLDVFGDTPTGNHTGQPLSRPPRAPSGAAAFGSLRSPYFAGPGRGAPTKTRWHFYRNNFTPPPRCLTRCPKNHAQKTGSY